MENEEQILIMKRCKVALFAVYLIPCFNLHATISYYFDGTLNESFGNLSAGTSFSGSLSYRYPQSPIGSMSTQWGSGSASYSIDNFNLRIGEETVNIESVSIFNTWLTIKNENPSGANNPYDSFSITLSPLTTNTNQSLGGETNITISLVLNDYSIQVFQNFDLPDDSLRLNKFINQESSWFFQPPPNNYLSLTSSTSSSTSPLSTFVPEPSALSLLAVGLGVLFRRSRKRD